MAARCPNGMNLKPHFSRCLKTNASLADVRFDMDFDSLWFGSGVNVGTIQAAGEERVCEQVTVEIRKHCVLDIVEKFRNAQQRR